MMNTQMDRKNNQPSWRRIAGDTLYFGVPLLVGLASIVFPIRTQLRQALVGFLILWFTVGGWLLNKAV